MNLLTDPLIPVVTALGREYRSLPALLAGLGDDSVRRIDGLQRHQEDAFYVFLCYLAGAVLAREGDWNPVRGEDFWRERLRALAGEAGDDAWRLVVDDLTRPAFMQPPQPSVAQGEAKWSAFIEAADVIDGTELAKNHDVKRSRATHAKPYEWIYALVSGHFNAGYSKGGKSGFYYPSIKAQKNRIGRVYVRPIIANDIAATWRVIVSALDRWMAESADTRLFNVGGIVLTWLQDWERKPFNVGEISPFFIETTRMVRLQQLSKDHLVACMRPTKSEPFVAQKQLQGGVPDPFIPVDADHKAIAAKAGRWPVEQMYRVVFEKEGVTWPLLGCLFDKKTINGEIRISFASMARSKKGTEGYVTSNVIIPSQRARFFFSGSHKEKLAKLGKEALDAANRMQKSVLYPALVKLVESAPSIERNPRDVEKLWINKITRRYDLLWSDLYFRWLMEVSIPLNISSERIKWIVILRDLAEKCLEKAEKELPERSSKRWRARSIARSTFYGSLTSSKNFPDLKEARHEHTA